MPTLSKLRLEEILAQAALITPMLVAVVFYDLALFPSCFPSLNSVFSLLTLRSFIS